MHIFASIEGMLNVFSWGFPWISEKTLGAEYYCCGLLSVIDMFIYLSLSLTEYSCADPECFVREYPPNLVLLFVVR